MATSDDPPASPPTSISAMEVIVCGGVIPLPDNRSPQEHYTDRISKLMEELKQKTAEAELADRVIEKNSHKKEVKRVP